MTNALEVRERSESAAQVGAEMQNPIVGLADIFPHVARRIVNFWGTPQLQAYLTGLTMMDRSDRAGFPPAAMDCLLGIWRYTQDIGAPNEGHDQWVNDVRLMKAFKKDDIEQARSWGSARNLNGSDAALVDMAQIFKPAKAKG